MSYRPLQALAALGALFVTTATPPACNNDLGLLDVDGQCEVMESQIERVQKLMMDIRVKIYSVDHYFNLGITRPVDVRKIYTRIRADLLGVLSDLNRFEQYVSKDENDEILKMKVLIGDLLFNMSRKLDLLEAKGTVGPGGFS